MLSKILRNSIGNPLLIAVPTALAAGAVATPKVDLLTDDVG
jgi:hypothetical protein